MTRKDKLIAMNGQTLIQVADKLGVKVKCNKTRTALKESKAAVIDRIIEAEGPEEPDAHIVETRKTPDALKEEESGPLIGETWIIAEPVIANAKKKPNLGMRMGKPKTTLLTEEEKELVKIYKELPVRKRTELLNYAYKLQDENGGPHEAKWVNISEMIDAPAIKKETKK